MKNIIEKQQVETWLESQVIDGLNAPASAFESVSASEIIANVKKKTEFPPSSFAKASEDKTRE